MTEHTILVVDDDPALAEMIGIVLAGEGYQLEFCADGAAAVDRFHEVQPDLVLLDLMLPGLSGIDVCRTIPARTASRSAPSCEPSRASPSSCSPRRATRPTSS